MIKELEQLALDIKELRSTTSSSSSLSPSNKFTTVNPTIRNATSPSPHLLDVPHPLQQSVDTIQAGLAGGYGEDLANRREHSAVYFAIPYIVLTYPTTESLGRVQHYADHTSPLERSSISTYSLCTNSKVPVFHRSI